MPKETLLCGRRRVGGSPWRGIPTGWRFDSLAEQTPRPGLSCDVLLVCLVSGRAHVLAFPTDSARLSGPRPIGGSDEAAPSQRRAFARAGVTCGKKRITVPACPAT